MKHMLSKGGIALVALSIMLSLAPKTFAQTAEFAPQQQQNTTQNNVIVSGKYSYDMTDGNGGFITKTGNFTLNHDKFNNNFTGYNFYNQKTVSIRESTVYVGIDNYLGLPNYTGPNNGQPTICAYNQNGIYRLNKPLAVLPDITAGAYSTSCIAATQQGVYAVYDRSHDLYIRMMITKIEYENYPTPGNQRPAVLQPTEGTRINQSQGNLTINWVTYNYATSYNLRMQCDPDNATKAWKEEVNNITGASYTYNLSRIPASNTNCHIYVVAVAQNGQRYGYPVRNFRLNPPAPVITSHKNYDTIYADYNTVLRWTSAPGSSSYGIQMTCETCSRPWSKIFLVNGNNTSVNIKNRLADLPDSSQRINIRIKRNDSAGTLSDPFYLTVVK